MLSLFVGVESRAAQPQQKPQRPQKPPKLKPPSVFKAEAAAAVFNVWYSTKGGAEARKFAGLDVALEFDQSKAEMALDATEEEYALQGNERSPDAPTDEQSLRTAFLGGWNAGVAVGRADFDVVGRSKFDVAVQSRQKEAIVVKAKAPAAEKVASDVGVKPQKLPKTKKTAAQGPPPTPLETKKVDRRPAAEAGAWGMRGTMMASPFRAAPPPPAQAQERPSLPLGAKKAGPVRTGAAAKVFTAWYYADVWAERWDAKALEVACDEALKVAYGDDKARAEMALEAVFESALESGEEVKINPDATEQSFKDAFLHGWNRVVDQHGVVDSSAFDVALENEYLQFK